MSDFYTESSMIVDYNFGMIKIDPIKNSVILQSLNKAGQTLLEK